MLSCLRLVPHVSTNILLATLLLFASALLSPPSLTAGDVLEIIPQKPQKFGTDSIDVSVDGVQQLGVKFKPTALTQDAKARALAAALEATGDYNVMLVTPVNAPVGVRITAKKPGKGVTSAAFSRFGNATGQTGAEYIVNPGQNNVFINRGSLSFDYGSTAPNGVLAGHDSSGSMSVFTASFSFFQPSTGQTVTSQSDFSFSQLQSFSNTQTPTADDLTNLTFQDLKDTLPLSLQPLLQLEPDPYGHELIAFSFPNMIGSPSVETNVTDVNAQFDLVLSGTGVPEPSSVILLTAGIVGSLGYVLRRESRRVVR